MTTLDIAYRFDPEALGTVDIETLDALRVGTIADITIDEEPLATLTADETNSLAHATSLASRAHAKSANGSAGPSPSGASRERPTPTSSQPRAA